MIHNLMTIKITMKKEKLIKLTKNNMLPIHKKLSELDSNKTQMNYDANSLYPSAMWDENSLYPKIETGSAFKPGMKDVYVEAFNNQTFDQDGDEFAILGKNITIHLVLRFNIYQLKKNLKK